MGISRKPSDKEPKADPGAPILSWTVGDIPDQTDRIAVITGANTGLGYETARALAARGANVILAVRNRAKGTAAAELIARCAPNAIVAVQELDLTSLASVAEAADAVRSSHDRIDLLINNAGVVSFTRTQTTQDGFELQLGTNYLGHFAFTGRLLDRLLPTLGSRVVTVSSNGHRLVRMRFDDLHGQRSYTGRAYNQSKLANLLFTYELQRRLTGKNTIAVAAHPGASTSELSRNLFAPVRLLFKSLQQSTEMGALPTLRAATDPAVLGGQFFGPGGPFQIRGYPKVVASSDRSHDTAAGQRLWAVSEELTGVTFPV